ncbi:MAG TPA: tetratricopeptide repeat protein [Gemmatimonadaceae bacterium]|nr:tetratricopeptide repeat protein [Gemmatimonadaceae bacterium]
MSRGKPPAHDSRLHEWLVPIGIALATVLTFAPALRDGFVSWDDAKNFLDNPHYRGLGLSHLEWMWTTFHLGHYVPLSWMTLGLDYTLWGMNPAGYHATSVALHAANAVLVYFVARHLFSAPRPSTNAQPPAAEITVPAAFAALAFALHPLRVESVVWITERRDTLSLLWYLSSLLAYLEYVAMAPVPAAGRRWYWTSLAMFVCALLSKGTSVTLPAVIALVNVYPLRRVSLDNWNSASVRRLLVELAPFAALSAAFSVLSIAALHPPAQLGIADKLAVSAYSLAFYLWKTLIPSGLSPLYEMPVHVDPAAARFVAGYIGCIAVAAIAWIARRRWPAVTAAIITFVWITLPMLGLVQNGPQIAADRYTYHSAPALAMLASAVLFAAVPIGTIAKRVTGSAVLLVLAALTWTQTSIWHDSSSLWSRVLAEDSNSAVGHSAMAALLYGEGRVDEGLEESRRALAISPNYAEAHNDFGFGLARKGQDAEAADEYRAALSLSPVNDEALNNLGIVMARHGQFDGAVDSFRRALEINPDYAEAHINWGNTLVRANRPDEAIAHYEAAVAIRPDHADAHENWGVALARLGRFEEAATQFRAALAIDPNHAQAKAYLAAALQQVAKN